MRAAQAVGDAERPGLEVGEHAVHPGQDDVGGQGPDDVGSWRMPDAPGSPDPPSVLAVAPVARLAARQACRLLAEKSPSAARRMRPGRPSWTSAAPAISSLPWPERPPPGGSSLARQAISVSSTSTRPARGARPGATRARRRLAPSSQALLSEPRPSCLCRCRAERPLEWVAISQAAQNHTVSGSLEPCSTVPAVTEVWRWQAAAGMSSLRRTLEFAENLFGSPTAHHLARGVFCHVTWRLR